MSKGLSSTVIFSATFFKFPVNFPFSNISNKRSVSHESKTHFSEMIEKYSALDSFGKEAVDAIINIEYNRCTNTVKVFKAAHSSNNEPPKVVNVPKSLIEKLENAPDSDDEGL